MITYKGLVTRSASIDSRGVRIATDVMDFTTGTTVMTPYDIGQADECPKIGWTYPSDPLSWCTSVSIEMHQPKYGYRVKASYSSERQLDENPLNEPAYYGLGNERFQEIVVKDNNGDAVLNSAGDPYDPPLMRMRNYPLITVYKNITADTLPTWLLPYEGAINSDAFTIRGETIAVGKAQVVRVNIGVPKTRNGFNYYAIELGIHVSERGWKKYSVDTGLRRRTSTGTRELITLTNTSGDIEYPPAPVPLDGNGDVLADPSPSNVIIKEYDIETSLPFSALPLT